MERAAKSCEDMGSHGFKGKQIAETLEKFEEETKEEKKQFTTADKFNEAILGAKGEASLAKKCNGLFVGNILLQNAIQQKHAYLMASSSKFIIIVPFGTIQSVVHIMAVPKIPIYNAVSVGACHLRLLRQMQAALVKVVTDILTPGSGPRELYLRWLTKAFAKKQTDLQHIHITEKETDLDSVKMDSGKAVRFIREMLNNYYNKKKKLGIPLEKVISTDVHLHNTNSVGQFHLHGWIAEPGLITDNGRKLLYKNTPLDRFCDGLSKYKGIEERRPNIWIIAKNRYEKI